MGEKPQKSGRKAAAHAMAAPPLAPPFLRDDELELVVSKLAEGFAPLRPSTASNAVAFAGTCQHLRMLCATLVAQLRRRHQMAKAALRKGWAAGVGCLLYTSPSPRDGLLSRMPSSA